MKKFEAGFFKGRVTSAFKKRGRFLYHILYEDGDAEDMNDKELNEAYALLKRQTVEEHVVQDKSEEDSENSGGETEGSDYAMSDEEERSRRKKKPKREVVAWTGCKDVCEDMSGVGH